MISKQEIQSQTEVKMLRCIKLRENCVTLSTCKWKAKSINFMVASCSGRNMNSDSKLDIKQVKITQQTGQKIFQLELKLIVRVGCMIQVIQQPGQWVTS